MPDITLVFPKSDFLIRSNVFPPLGIMYLSAYLQANGLNVQCLDMGIGHTPDMAESDTIGISITTPQRHEAFALAEYYQEQGRKTIAGGPHATHMVDECKMNGFHHVLRGHSGRQLIGLLTHDFGVLSGEFPDRDALPIKEYRYEIDGEPATPIMTSWGCPYHCSFCGKIDDGFQMQSAERTIDEIEHVHRKYGYEAFMIFDDVFVASKKRLTKIVNKIGGKYLFRCFARSNLLDDKTCELLKKLGVVEVGIGIESGSNDVLERSMKGTTRALNTRAVERLHNHGIRVKALLIVGLPGETNETIVETADWIEEAQPDDVDISIFQPMPGSKIFADPAKWGIKFAYNGQPSWYKGTPGQYEANIETEELTGEEIVQWRDMLEMEYKPKELLK